MFWIFYLCFLILNTIKYKNVKSFHGLDFCNYETKSNWNNAVNLGFYSSFCNPILSPLNNRVYRIDFYIPYDPLSYRIEWFWRYGMLTVVLAVVGVYFLIIGYRYIKSSPKEG